ncbi:MAG: two-component regulator propeller domain-containing protein [Verrucomicrobiota bacterium]
MSSRNAISGFLLGAILMAGAVFPVRAVILWSDLGATLVHDSGPGTDILGGAVKENDSSTNTLYFKFHVAPLSDVSTEEYFAGFELYEGDTARLAVGNSLKAWAYSAFNTSETGLSNTVPGDLDLHSSQPESAGLGTFYLYELPRRGIERTIVFKVQYLPRQEDLVTVWLNPDLSPNATEDSQPESLTTKFKANATFDQIRLRHGGGGKGWTFSDMAIATSFADFVTAANSGPGQGSPPFTFRAWQREQGLPENSVRALAQTRDGYLWVGSDGGLARFDGVRFVSFGTREGLRSGPVSVLLEDSRGTLWIGTAAGGLSRLEHGKFTNFTVRDGLPSDSITALGEDSQNRLFVGTEGGLAVWQGGTFGALNGAEAFQGKAVPALFRDPHGSLWIAVTGAGVFRFTGTRLLAVTNELVDALLRDAHCLLLDHAGRLWVGAGDDYVLCREGEKWRRTEIVRHLARPYVSALVEEPNGTVWAGSVSEGLFGFKSGEPLAPNASSGLSDNSVQSLLVDREGNMWVGTGAGLNRLRRGNLSVRGQNEGLGYGAVQGLAEIEPGIIWAGKPSDGVYRWSNGSFSKITNDLLQRFPRVNSLLMARDGSVWVANANGLLHFRDPKNTGAETNFSALEGLNVLSLANGSQGAIWAGTREGELWQLQNGAWRKENNFPRTHAIAAIAPAPDGSVWVGTQGDGLYQFQGGVRLHLDKSAGLLSDLVRALYLDAQGTLWIGTTGDGLSRWREGRVTTLTTREGLPDNTISQILEDDSGRLWLGSDWGIARARKDELAQALNGNNAPLNLQIYGRAEGMVSEECTGGFSPAGLKTKSGLLWFSTLKGVVVADPSPQTAPAPPPDVVLEEVMVDSVATPMTDLRIAPGRRRLEFRYTGLSFSAPERVRFRYRLEGLDSDWVDAGASRAALYSYVPPGHYHFHVIACNNDGVWTESGASLPLTVLPHLWQEWWFLALATIGLIGSIGGGIRVIEKRQMHRRLAQLERERVLERERARIAQDLHDDLGSSLTRISLLSGLARQDKDNAGQVELHINKISQSAEQTLRALEEIVWAIRPGSDSLQSLVEYIAHFANELFEGDGLRCRLDLPADLPSRPLPPETRHSIFLVVKEALTNSLKHSAAREVRVQAKVADDVLHIIVQDDGKGFDTHGQSRGNGLGNMRRRAQAMGGNVTVESRPGHGTTVSLTLHFAPVQTDGKAAP